MAAVAASYAAGKTDEFIEPAVIVRDGRPVGRIAPGDSVIFFNFRADRAREITRALTQETFDRFPRPERLSLTYACMTAYDETFGLPVGLPPAARSTTSWRGRWPTRALPNLRIAETEKYAHVTYFFNGGEETVYPGESRILIPSPSVPTYDLKPEMSAYEVGERAVAEIASGKHDLMVLNFANGDMVGHTGILPAAIQAVEAVDRNLQRVVEKVWEVGGAALVTADHGNAEHDDRPEDRRSLHRAHDEPRAPRPRRPAGRRRRGCGKTAPSRTSPRRSSNLLALPVPAEMTGADVREG